MFSYLNKKNFKKKELSIQLRMVWKEWKQTSPWNHNEITIKISINYKYKSKATELRKLKIYKTLAHLNKKAWEEYDYN